MNPPMSVAFRVLGRPLCQRAFGRFGRFSTLNRTRGISRLLYFPPKLLFLSKWPSEVRLGLLPLRQSFFLNPTRTNNIMERGEGGFEEGGEAQRPRIPGREVRASKTVHYLPHVSAMRLYRFPPILKDHYNPPRKISHSGIFMRPLPLTGC